jgi:hypothetical protein
MRYPVETDNRMTVIGQFGDNAPAELAAASGHDDPHSAPQYSIFLPAWYRPTNGKAIAIEHQSCSDSTGASRTD